MEVSGEFGAAVARLHHRLTDGPPKRWRRIFVWGLVALAFVLVLLGLRRRAARRPLNP